MRSSSTRNPATLTSRICGNVSGQKGSWHIQVETQHQPCIPALPDCVLVIKSSLHHTSATLRYHRLSAPRACLQGTLLLGQSSCPYSSCKQNKHRHWSLTQNGVWRRIVPLLRPLKEARWIAGMGALGASPLYSWAPAAEDKSGTCPSPEGIF
jgi:hypothetical protein